MKVIEVLYVRGYFNVLAIYIFCYLFGFKTRIFHIHLMNHREPTYIYLISCLLLLVKPMFFLAVRFANYYFHFCPAWWQIWILGPCQDSKFSEELFTICFFSNLHMARKIKNCWGNLFFLFSCIITYCIRSLLVKSVVY